MEADLFFSCSHYWVFQICWHIECSTSTASSFRIWNSSAAVPLPPLDLSVVMLPKSHLTSHSSMSGSRWGSTPSWLFWSLRSFLYSSSVFLPPILIYCADVRSLPFLSFMVSILAWNTLLIIPIFLKQSLVFPSLLFSSISLHCPFKKSLISLCYSLDLCIQLGIFPFLPCLLLPLFPWRFVKPPQITTLPSCSFSLGWFWSLSPVQCYGLQSIVLQVHFFFSSRSNPLTLFVTSII